MPDGDLDGYTQIGGNCAVDRTYLPQNFGNDVPLSLNRDPLFVAAGTRPGWNHVQSQPDVFTGEVGPSFSFYDILVRNWLIGNVDTAFFSADCGGVLHSGIAAIQPDGTSTVEAPLFNFGPCETAELGLIAEHTTGERTAINIPSASLENSGSFDVGQLEQAAGTPNVEPYPQIFGPDSVDAGWSDSVQTVANVFGGTETTAPNCNSMVEPGAIVGGDVLLLEGSPACTNRFWVFAAAQQSVDFELTVEDTVTGHFATYVNPMGEIRPAIADTIDRAALAPLFDSAAATALLDEAGWSLETSGDDRVRALIRDDSITFVFPQDAVDPADGTADDLFYTLTSTIDGNTTEQPQVPVVGLITLPPTLEVIEPEAEVVEEEPAIPPQLIETLDEFYFQLSASIAAGDVGFAFDRLAPAVLEAYPTECPAALESFADPELTIVPTSEGDPEPWTWELVDGRTFDIPSAIPVTVVLTGRGQPGTESDAHLEVINGQYHWFTFCE